MTLTKFLFITIIIQLSGCASYYASRDDYSDKINEWLINNEFSKIEDSLKELSQDHINYKTIIAKKELIETRKNYFIEHTLIAAKKMQSEEKWQLALDEFNEAIDRTSNNKKLLLARNKLILERNVQIIELRKNMLLRRSRALVQYKPIYKKLKTLIPNDYEAQNDIKNFESEINETSYRLMTYGEQALDNKNYSLAEECFELSNKLASSTKAENLIVNVESIIKTNDNKIKTSELIKTYNEAYESGNFPKARLYLQQLLTINPQHEKSRQLKEQLDRDINTRIEKGINLGKSQYSKGKISAALKTWTESSRLDPKNEELTALIHRAKKVSSKIEELEKN